MVEEELADGRLVQLDVRDLQIERDLHVLRAKYAALANRVDAETADVFFHGVPRVTTRRSGTIVSPTVRPSGAMM